MKTDSSAARSRAGKKCFSKIFCVFQWLSRDGSRGLFRRINSLRVIAGKASSPDFTFPQMRSGEDFWFPPQAEKEEKEKEEKTTLHFSLYPSLGLPYWSSHFPDLRDLGVANLLGPYYQGAPQMPASSTLSPQPLRLVAVSWTGPACGRLRQVSVLSQVPHLSLCLGGKSGWSHSVSWLPFLVPVPFFNQLVIEGVTSTLIWLIQFCWLFLGRGRSSR